MTPLSVEKASLTRSQIEEPIHGITVEMSWRIDRRRQTMDLHDSRGEITDSECGCLCRARFDFHYASCRIEGELSRYVCPFPEVGNGGPVGGADQSCGTSPTLRSDDSEL